MQDMQAFHKMMTKEFKQHWEPVPGFQLRYMYFINPAARDRLTVPILPYTAIAEAGAGMYKGQPRDKQAMAGDHPVQRRGSTDRHAP